MGNRHYRPQIDSDCAKQILVRKLNGKKVCVYERNGTFHGKPYCRQDGRFQRNFLLSVKKAQYANTTWNKAKKAVSLLSKEQLNNKHLPKQTKTFTPNCLQR